MRTQRSPLFYRVLGLLAVFGLLWTGIAAAASGIDRQTLELKLGGSDLIKTAAPFTRVTIANPAIADVVVLSPREIYVFGKKLGFTSMILWEDGKDKTVLDVVISLDTIPLKKQLHDQFPNEKIEVQASETGVVLSGTVSGPEVVEEAIRLTKTFLPKIAEGKETGSSSEEKGVSGLSGPGVTNLLKINGLQQVMLEVTFAEVNKDSGRDLQLGIGSDHIGNDVTGAFGTGPVGVTGTGTTMKDATGKTVIDIPAGSGGNLFTGSLLLNFAGNTVSGLGSNAANMFINIEHFTAALQFLESEGLARTLAEPRLVTQTGKEASFLAGGEFPIPVADQYGNITITYKPFGVALAFTPVVMSDGKISLHVVPSVSAITGYQQATVAGGTVPVLSTRNLETTVQLYDGQTLALAGLLQDNVHESVRKIPFLGDIPILGTLFRSTGYSQGKTDLMIAVTPHLVKPVPEGSVKFPGAAMQIPNRYEFYLEGRLEGARSDNDEPGIKPHDFPPAPQAAAQSGGLEGNFGYQPVKAD